MSSFNANVRWYAHLARKSGFDFDSRSFKWMLLNGGSFDPDAVDMTDIAANEIDYDGYTAGGMSATGVTESEPVVDGADRLVNLIADPTIFADLDWTDGITAAVLYSTDDDTPVLWTFPDPSDSPLSDAGDFVIAGNDNIIAQSYIQTEV